MITGPATKITNLGAMKSVLGMTVCRHKTKHWYFRAFFPLMLAVQIALQVVGYWMFVQ